MDHSNETSLVWLWQYLRIVPLIFLHSCEVLSFLWPALIRKLVFIWFVLFCPQAVFRRRPQLGRLYTHRFTRTGESLWSVRLLLSYRQSLCSGRQGWSHRWSGQYLYTRGGGGGGRGGYTVHRILNFGVEPMWAPPPPPPLRTPDFNCWGWSNVGKNQNPKNSLDQKINPK